MNVSTAMNKLRTKVLFHLLKQHNNNTCFRCGKKINKADDLSIEHKKPWMYHPENDNRRFWHMSNIAFSHRKCNRPHVHGAIKTRKVGPKNTVWCGLCQKFWPYQKFHKDKNRWNGFRSLCKTCASIKQKQYRKK
jgi:hypothetical protein